MSAKARGFSVYRAGWGGQTTLASATDTIIVFPAAHTSALTYASRLAEFGVANIGSDFAFSVNSSSRIVFSCGTAFAMTFTGVAGSRLGFPASTSMATTHTASNAARGAVFPYTSESMRYTLDVPSASATGFSLEGRSILRRTPGTDWKQPDLSLSCIRGTALEVAEAFEDLDTPSKLAVFVEPSTVVELQLGSVKVTTEEEFSGWTTFQFQVAT